jgi:hypothetical protein
MQATGLNRISRRLAATTGLLLILVAGTAGADPLDADVATASESQQQLVDLAASEVNVSASSSSVDSSSVSASKESATTGGEPAGPGDDEGAFLGQLVARYFESYN